MTYRLRAARRERLSRQPSAHAANGWRFNGRANGAYAFYNAQRISHQVGRSQITHPPCKGAPESSLMTRGQTSAGFGRFSTFQLDFQSCALGFM